MQRIYKVAKVWLFQGLVEPIEPRDAKKVTKNKIIYLATGSQENQWGQ